MAIELNITPEDVEALVRESIMKCGFGKAVEVGIQKAFSGYDNPIEKELKNYVSEVCRVLIREKFSEQIKSAVAKAVESRVTDDLVNQTVNTTMEKMIRAAENNY